jgi:hypothetical protein
MSISTYFKPNIHQNGPEILGVNTEQHARYLVPGLRRCSLEGQVSVVELNGTGMLQPCFFKNWEMLQRWCGEDTVQIWLWRIWW